MLQKNKVAVCWLASYLVDHMAFVINLGQMELATFLISVHSCVLLRWLASYNR